MRTVVIAEVGECFNGNLETARQMIHAAKTAGCDLVKFQLLDMEEVSPDDPEREWFSKLDLAPPRLQQLLEWCAEEGIEPLFTPVSVRTAQWLADAGQTRVKIASSFVRKTELLRYISENFTTVYASTGMASLSDIDALLAELRDVPEVRLLHCISEYPTGPLLELRGLTAMAEEDAHLNMMRILKSRYPDRMVGYSDHTAGIFVPVIAAAMGAEIIEKHFTLDRNAAIRAYEYGDYMGTDHILSVEPDSLFRMVDAIRRIGRIQGNSIWKRSKGEMLLKEFLRGRYRERNTDEDCNTD